VIEMVGLPAAVETQASLQQVLHNLESGGEAHRMPTMLANSFEYVWGTG